MISKEADTAVLAAENAVKHNPTNFECHVALGQAYTLANRFNLALAAFQQAVMLNPSAENAYHGIGQVRAHTGPSEAVIEAYETAIALNSHYIDSIYDLGIFYAARLGDYDSAVAVLLRGLTHNPDHPLLLVDLGHTYARMGEFQKAISALQRVLIVQPNTSSAYALLSILFLHLKRYDDTIVACQREIELKDAHSPHRLLGYIYDHRGRYDEAIFHLERSIALEPQDYEAHGALARVYRTVGREEAAHEAFTVAQSMAMRDDEYGQACFEAVSGNVDQAVQLLKQGLAKGQVQSGWVRIDPEFAFMIDDPRFKALFHE